MRFLPEFQVGTRHDGTPTDNMIAAGMATVTMVTNENKLPVICGEKGMVDAGGLATYGIDYYQLGAT